MKEDIRKTKKDAEQEMAKLEQQYK